MITFGVEKMIKLKAVAYCRISTYEDMQQHSLESQKKHYENLINSRNDCIFFGLYYDISSGLNLKNRPQFNEMIKACKKGKIDIIYTKSISRFSRNTLDFLKTIRTLKDIGVDVIFENEKIQLSKERNELRMTTYATMAQQESIIKSNSIKWGLNIRFVNGISGLANRVCYGYIHDEKGNLIPDPQKSECVRMIFNLYLNGKSLSGISKELYKRSILSPTGKDKWTSCAIDKILSNEKYIGSVLLQKTYVPDVFEQIQAKNNGERPQYLYENNHIGIIDEKTFKAVQAERCRRSKFKQNAL